MDVSGADDSTVAFHLLLDPDEAQITRHALDLLISDESHEPLIRGLAREVLAMLDAPEHASGASAATLSLPLTQQQMKITHAAVKLLLNDSSREQESERALLWSILGKLPDEHVMRAIELD
jgi:5-methylcytosine-specific restriction endonuclease McrBC regulatory subunit McrC